jgi:fructose/tagatose bisphosphate aldolase
LIEVEGLYTQTLASLERNFAAELTLSKQKEAALEGRLKDALTSLSAAQASSTTALASVAALATSKEQEALLQGQLKEASDEIAALSTKTAGVSAELEILISFTKHIEHARQAKRAPVASHTDRLTKVDRLLNIIKAFVSSK